MWQKGTFVEFDNSLGVAVRKVRDALNDDAESARYLETVPRRGYRFTAPVRRVMSASPDLRSTTAPSGAPARGLTLSSQPSRFKTRKSSILILAILFLIVAGVAVGRHQFQAASSPSPDHAAQMTIMPPKVTGRPSVAVLGFRNLPGRPEEDWLSSAFSEMLSTELAAGGGLRLVSGEDIARARRELHLGDESTLAKPTLDRLRLNPGADIVVLGSYTTLGKKPSRIRLDIRLQDTRTGETIAEDAVTGNEENLFELVSEAGARLRANLGLSFTSEDAAVAARASLPANQSALKFYTEGRSKLWQFDFVSARHMLEKAIAADPNYPLAHAALSETWFHLGYAAKERAEAARALQLSTRLSQEGRLLVEGRDQRSVNDGAHAVSVYQQLFAAFPDNLEYGLKLASAQLSISPPESRRTLTLLRRLPAPGGDDSRLDLMEASAWIGEDLEKAEAAAQRAVDKGMAIGSPLLVARAYGILCQQPVAVGHSLAQRIDDCEKAERSYATAGDKDNQARTLNDLAGVIFFEGDPRKSGEMWREAAMEFKETGDVEGVAATLNNLGETYISRGDLSRGKRLIEASIPKYKVVEDSDGVALALNDLGDLARQTGDLNLAESRYYKARDIANKIADKSAAAYILVGLGDTSTDRGNLIKAGKFYEESLALRTQIGEKQTIVESQIALARLSLESGHAADAEANLRKYQDQLLQEPQADDELALRTLLINALLSEGRLEDARRESESEQTSKSSSVFVRLQFDLASANVILASNHAKAAKLQLAKLLQDAQGYGFLGLEFEVLLDSAQLEKKAGRESSARSKLDLLAKKAGDRGFGLIARKALASGG
ncbi:MAG: tetratricopeptide repeat protein [Terriglobales bacterium]